MVPEAMDLRLQPRLLVTGGAAKTREPPWRFVSQPLPTGKTLPIRRINHPTLTSRGMWLRIRTSMCVCAGMGVQISNP